MDSYHHPYFLELKKKATAQLKNVTEDAIFVKIFLYYLLSLLIMLPNANIKKRFFNL